MVQPGPGRPAALGGAQPGVARPVDRLVPAPGPDPADDRPPAAAQHEASEPPEHRGPLRPRERVLPDVPRRDHDLLERGLRHARSVAGGCPAEQVPADGGGRRADARSARPGDRHGLGRLRAVCCRRAGLPGDVADDLARAVRPGPRTRPGRRARAPRRHPAARLPRHHRHLRRDRVDRDARSRRGRVLRTILRDLRRRARAGRTAEPAVDHLPGRGLRPPAPRRELDPDLHLPGRPVPVARGHRRGDPRHGAADRAGDRHRRRLRPDPAGLADALHGPGRQPSARWASTTASCGCGSTTSP